VRVTTSLVYNLEF